MKKLLFLFIFLFFFFEVHPVHSEMEAGINYRIDYESDSPTRFAQNFVDFKAGGMTKISIVLYWGTYESTNGNYIASEYTKLNHVLTAADNAGLKVHIDFHTLFPSSDSGWATPTNLNGNTMLILTEPGKTQFLNWISYTVNQIKNHPSIETYAVLNEPCRYSMTSTQVAQTIQLWTDARTAVKTLHDKPVGVRFDAGINTYFTQSDLSNLDIMFINEYLDHRDPNYNAWGLTWSRLANWISWTHSNGKLLYVTEWNGYKTTPVITYDYMSGHLQKLSDIDVDASFFWGWKGTSSWEWDLALEDGVTSKVSLDVFSSYNPPETYTATFSQSGIPSGTLWEVTVGGTKYTSTSASLTVPDLTEAVSYTYTSPISGTSGTRYSCTSGYSGSVTYTSQTATATYTTQYYLTMNVNPAGSGTVNTSSNWYNAGSSVGIRVTANGGYSFSSWTGSGTGSYSGTTNPVRINVNSPITQTANFNSVKELVGYWKFDETSGTTATDSSGKGNTGTLVNGPVWVSGYANNALRFDGSNDYVNVSNNNYLTGFNEGFTATFWIKLNDINKRQTILNKYDSTGNQRGWFIEYNGTTKSINFFASEDGVGYSYWYAVLNPTTSWYHIAVVWNKSTVPKFYINAQQVSTVGTSTISKIYNNINAQFNIGKSSYVSGRELKANLDQIKIYNYALSANDIINEYYSTHTGGGGGCPILEAWNGNSFVKIEKLNIHAPKGVDTFYSTNFNMQSVDGRYELILREANYISLESFMENPDGSNIDSIKLVDASGKECRLVSAIHSKQGNVLSALQSSDDVRVQTLPNEEIRLVYEDCFGGDFKFSIEGYNYFYMKFMMPYVLDIAISAISIILILIEVIVIAMIIKRLRHSKKKMILHKSSRRKR